jgi:EmrB/QacA subfamily drug resistance transporter
MSRNQRLVLLASILGSFIVFLEVAAVNVALPAIERDIGGGISAQQWVVDAYLLTLASLILIAGSLSDLFGRRRVFAAGLIGFAATSIMCAVAPRADLLILARGLQGVAGAMLVPSSLALIISNFEGPAQGKAIGTWTAWTGTAFVAGPLVGGTLVDLSSWRMVFAINVVPVAATLLVLGRTAPEARAGTRTPVDFVGAGLCALGLGGIIFALIEEPARTWSAPAIYVPLACGVVTFAAFLVFEGATAHPMLDLALFRRRNFAVGNLATVAIYGGLTAFTFLMTVFLQQVAHYSGLAGGLGMLPVAAILFVLSPIFGRLAGRHGPRLYMTIGPITSGAGFVLMTACDQRAIYLTQLLPGLVLFGLGLSATIAPLTTTILGDVDQRQAGIASAINNAVARVAGLLAIAAIGALVSVRFEASIDHNAASDATLDARARAALVEARRRPLEVATAIPPGVPARSREQLVPLLQAASVDTLHAGLWAMAGLLTLGGVISGVWIVNPSAFRKREVHDGASSPARPHHPVTGP